MHANSRERLTEYAVLGAGDAPVELAVSSYLNFALGLEKDLKMSDCSLFAATGWLAGFFGTSLGRSALISGATAAWDVDLIDLLLDVGRSNDLTAIFGSLLMPWLLLLALSLIFSMEIGCASIGGRLPVLRYNNQYQV